jgi:hypothetical protein
VLATLDGRGLSTPVTGGFTGTMIGPYVFGAPASDPADPADPDGAGGPAPTAWWDWFEYRSG